MVVDFNSFIYQYGFADKGNSSTTHRGTAYAVWTGIGAVGIVLVGILVFKEPATFLRLFFITTLICSIIGIKAVSH